MTRVSGGDGSDEGELEDHFDSSDSDPKDDEGDVSDDGSLEEIEAPSRNSGTRSIYSLSKFTPIADFMKIAKFALQAFASIGSSDCSLEPLSLPLSFARKGKAAVLSPATDGRFAKLCLFQQDEADLIPGATYDVDVAAMSTKAREAVAALRGGSSAAQVDKGDGAITFFLDIFDSEGERLQRTAGIAVIPGSGIIIIDHIGVFTKGVGHGRVVWMAMILVGAHILKAIFNTEAVASIVKEPNGDGPGFYRYMGYSTYKADGNRNLRLPVNVLSGGDSCAAIGDEPERPKFSGWSYVGLPPKHYPDQTGDSTSCGPMALMALNYEGDGLQPNFSKENCQEGASSGRVRTALIAAGSTPYGRHSAQGGD